MKIYGYSETDDKEDELLEMSEISFSVTPTELRVLADFMRKCAEAMERHGVAFGHEHFSDFTKQKNIAPEIVVVR